MSLVGFAMTSATWLSLDSPSDLTTVTLPKGVKYLYDQAINNKEMAAF